MEMTDMYFGDIVMLSLIKHHLQIGIGSIEFHECTVFLLYSLYS